MKRCFVIAFACLVVVTASPSQTDLSKAVQKQSVQGKVVETKSGHPIRKVNLEVQGGAEQSFSQYTATTNADGTDGFRE